MFYWQDIKYSFRLLAKTPIFSLLTVVVLAGGLGVSIFTFSFLYTAMVKPLPVPAGDRIVRVMLSGPDGAGVLDAADLAGMRPQIRTLAELGAYTGKEVVVGTAGAARAIEATATEWNVFAVTRSQPMLGRILQPADQEPGAEPVIVLSHAVWRAAFGGDTSLIGKHVTLNGVPTRLIGVMSEGYSFPIAAEAWVPIAPELLAATTPNQHYVQVYARLAPGVDVEQASAELTGLLQRSRAARPVDVTGWCCSRRVHSSRSRLPYWAALYHCGPPTSS